MTIMWCLKVCIKYYRRQVSRTKRGSIQVICRLLTKSVTYMYTQMEHLSFLLKPKQNVQFIINVCLMVPRVLCCSKCLFLDRPFCHGALKLDLTTSFLCLSLQLIVWFLCIDPHDCLVHNSQSFKSMHTYSLIRMALLRVVH